MNNLDNSTNNKNVSSYDVEDSIVSNDIENNIIKDNRKKKENIESEELLREQSDLFLKNIDLINNIFINVTVELGSTKIKIKDLLSISQGKIITLNTLAGESLKILANGLLIAHGEIVVVDNKYGIRITNVLNSITSSSYFNKT